MTQTSLSSLPAEAVRHILTYLRPADIHHLHIAFPPTSSLRQHTHDPHLWRSLYRRDFQPPPPPLLRLTSTGTLDWRAAYVEAERRQQSVRRQRDRGWGFPEHRRHRTPRPGVVRFAWSARLGSGQLVSADLSRISPQLEHESARPARSSHSDGGGPHQGEV